VVSDREADEMPFAAERVLRRHFRWCSLASPAALNTFHISRQKRPLASASACEHPVTDDIGARQSDSRKPVETPPLARCRTSVSAGSADVLGQLGRRGLGGYGFIPRRVRAPTPRIEGFQGGLECSRYVMEKSPWRREPKNPGGGPLATYVDARGLLAGETLGGREDIRCGRSGHSAGARCVCSGSRFYQHPYSHAPDLVGTRESHALGREPRAGRRRRSACGVS